MCFGKIYIKDLKFFRLVFFWAGNVVEQFLLTINRVSVNLLYSERNTHPTQEKGTENVETNRSTRLLPGGHRDGVKVTVILHDRGRVGTVLSVLQPYFTESPDTSSSRVERRGTDGSHEYTCTYACRPMVCSIGYFPCVLPTVVFCYESVNVEL